MIKREFTADYINHVANHPSVRHGAKVDLLEGLADFATLIANQDNHLLTFDGGCFLLMKQGDQYEIHTMALKHGRGQPVRNAVCEMLDYMFTTVGAHTLVTMASPDNQAACKLANDFMTKTHSDAEYNHYSLSREQWERRAA